MSNSPTLSKKTHNKKNFPHSPLVFETPFTPYSPSVCFLLLYYKMVFFGLFFPLFFLLFWVSFPQNRRLGFFSSLAAFLTGMILALIRYLVIVEPRVHDFGWSLYGIALLFHLMPPVVLSLAVLFPIRRLCVIPAENDGGADKAGGWATRLFIALVPYSMIFTLTAAEPGTVKPLVLLPLLWVMSVITMHFFYIRVAAASRLLPRALFAALALAVPFCLAGVYQAWFAKDVILCILFFLPSAVLSGLHFILDYRAAA
jgi:hypothetical protein